MAHPSHRSHASSSSSSSAPSAPAASINPRVQHALPSLTVTVRPPPPATVVEYEILPPLDDILLQALPPFSPPPSTARYLCKRPSYLEEQERIRCLLSFESDFYPIEGIFSPRPVNPGLASPPGTHQCLNPGLASPPGTHQCLMNNWGGHYQAPDQLYPYSLTDMDVHDGAAESPSPPLATLTMEAANEEYQLQGGLPPLVDQNTPEAQYQAPDQLYPYSLLDMDVHEYGAAESPSPPLANLTMEAATEEYQLQGGLTPLVDQMGNLLYVGDAPNAGAGMLDEQPSVMICGDDEDPNFEERVSAAAPDDGGDVAIIVPTTLLNLHDGYVWRKYGAKPIKGRLYPRGYFRCAQPGCPCKKMSERSSEKEDQCIFTYKNRHNHHP